VSLSMVTAQPLHGSAEIPEYPGAAVCGPKRIFPGAKSSFFFFFWNGSAKSSRQAEVAVAGFLSSARTGITDFQMQHGLRRSQNQSFFLDNFVPMYVYGARYHTHVRNGISSGPWIPCQLRRAGGGSTLGRDLPPHYHILKTPP
jgi:hypothetical protein